MVTRERRIYKSNMMLLFIPGQMKQSILSSNYDDCVWKSCLLCVFAHVLLISVESCVDTANTGYDQALQS